MSGRRLSQSSSVFDGLRTVSGKGGQTRALGKRLNARVSSKNRSHLSGEWKLTKCDPRSVRRFFVESPKGANHLLSRGT